MKGFIKSLGYAWNGLRIAFSGQKNLSIHLVVAIAVIVLGFYFDVTESEWLTILIVIGFVITSELFNTAIEHIVDLVSPQYQPLAGKIKDIAAGAVLVAALTAITVGLLIFTKYLF